MNEKYSWCLIVEGWIDRMRQGTISQEESFRLERLLIRARLRGCSATLDDMIELFMDPRKTRREIVEKLHSFADHGEITMADFREVSAITPGNTQRRGQEIR